MRLKSGSKTWVGCTVCRVEIRNGYKILVDRPEGKELPGRLRHRWEDNITMDLKEMGWRAVD